jgi:hypothetical protein
MGCEDQKEKDDITKILMEKKPWFISAYNWRKRESHSWDVKTKKKERQRAQKSRWKKRGKSHDSSSNLQLGTSIFPRKIGWSWLWKKLMEFGCQKRLTVKGSPA